MPLETAQPLFAVTDLQPIQDPKDKVILIVELRNLPFVTCKSQVPTCKTHMLMTSENYATSITISRVDRLLDRLNNQSRFSYEINKYALVNID